MADTPVVQPEAKPCYICAKPAVRPCPSCGRHICDEHWMAYSECCPTCTP